MENSQEKNLIDIKGLKDKKVIDLVVPMYKAKNTLMRLLASVVSQSMRENIHIILVKDADGEDYSELLNMFSKMLDIELIELVKNSGPGTSRRIGTKKGKSKYIMYMDADDTFQNPFAVQELYTTIEFGNLDAVNSIFLEQISDIKFIHHDNNDRIWVFGKIYRRSYLEENKIEMNDSRANEDTGFNRVIFNTGKVGYLNDITYIWHFNKDSITRKDDGIYRFTGIKGWIKNMAWSNGEMKRLNIDEKIYKSLVLECMVDAYFFYLGFYSDEDKRVKPELIIKWLKKYYWRYYKEQNYTKEEILECYRKMSPNREEIVKFIPEINIYQFIEKVGDEK